MSRIKKVTDIPFSELSKIGIYKLWFENDPKKRPYIGSAVRKGVHYSKKGFLSRLNLHLSNLINNHNCTPKLQNAFNKYGLDNLRFEIIEILEEGKPNTYYAEIETKYIAEFDSVKNGWNININGKNCVGTPMREEVKIKIGAANSGKNNGMYGKFNEKNPTSKRVYQYDLDGNFIKGWESAREIERTLHICYKQISQSMKTKSKYCKGFLWYNEHKGMFVDKYIPYDKIKNLKK